METDEQFVERMRVRGAWAPDSDVARLFALARRGAAADAEIERLRADNLRLYELGKKWMQERSGQRKETERLRAALRAILNVPANWGSEIYDIEEIARAALEERT